MLAGSAAAPLGDALALAALPADVTAATETAAGLAHRRSSQAGDAANPGAREHGPVEMPLLYEIRIKGRVGDHLADALGLDAEVEPVDTILRGPVDGQEGLHAILARLQDLGLELVEIRQLPPT